MFLLKHIYYYFDINDDILVYRINTHRSDLEIAEPNETELLQNVCCHVFQ